MNKVIVVAAILALTACAGNGTAVVKPESSSSNNKPVSTYQDPVSDKVLRVIQGLEQRIRSMPSDITANLELAAVLRQIERFDEAKKYLDQAQAISPNSPQVLNELGILQRTKGEFKQAEQIYLSILANHPDYYDAHFNLGILYDLYLRQPENAQKHYKAYLAGAPDADKRVEKWLLDLQRRFQLGALFLGNLQDQG